MDADEIVPLTAKAISDLLASRLGTETDDEPGKRRAQRWPFPGAVEVWIPDDQGRERHVLGACHNLSDRGVGVRCDEELKVGATLSIAIHQPELSLHGKGVVRHCSSRDDGYLAGFEFVFD